MQTFLPYPDFKKSAACLDRQRLGKQRVECFQILNVLTGNSKGWINHPIVKAWRGYELALAQYGWHICNEWIQRGYKDTMKHRILNLIGNQNILDAVIPPWLNEEFCRSHQSNLIRKNPEFYRPIFGADVPDNLDYIWPK